MRPTKGDYPEYYDYYINLIPENDVLSALKNNQQEIISFINSVPKEKADYKYAEEKWTIKQVLNHINDTERIFSYRALRFSRGDAQALLGFDQNTYVANANLVHVDLEFLAEEFNAIRNSTILQFKQLAEKELLLKGNTARGQVNVLSLGFMVCGHAKHHINVIKEKYLNTK